MPFRVLPIEPVGSDEWNVPDEAIASLWRRMVAADKVTQTFYAGGIAGPDEFLRFVKARDIAACIVIDDEARQPAVFAWLTNIENAAAFAHYCVFGRPSRAAGQAVLALWEQMRRPDGQPLLEVLLGITPEIHDAALRVLRILGFTSIGVIPRYCNCVYAGGRCGAVISYREFIRPGTASQSRPTVEHDPRRATGPGTAACDS